MPEANDFNAIRISLASPEQIRSWSYGEVTKPETINYRTLKPEKDGLFCEKIFGPTKDFECYCGKYKRQRYKGIVCDRCGVEVARSKVRRERMGHIELAAPVSHVWFAKGIPSRLGLLLDLSPRSLERVLYFSQFIVISVDEEAKARSIKELLAERDAAIAAKEKAAAEKTGTVDARLQEALQKIQAPSETGEETSEKEVVSVAEALTKKAVSLDKTLEKLVGKATPRAIHFEGQEIAAKGVEIEEAHREALKSLMAKEVARREALTLESQLRQEEVREAEVENLQAEAEGQISQIQRQLDLETGEIEDTYQGKVEELEEIRPMTLLVDSRYKELKDKYGAVFTAGTGAEAVLEILATVDLDKLRETLHNEIQSSSGQRRKKATKRLRVVEAFRKSGNKPEWMILRLLPVLPPDLRPMVQLDGGRFATSDLNDLYRRVINRNNRLRKLLDLGAPEIIIRNEKRMLQEAVDALIDNGRRGRPISGSHNHKLKSLSDMLRGKQGRFRQNLLGKRVDYSGRSVIVVGPELKLNQCGLPKWMALELFKPFVMHKLVAEGLAHNIKSAKRMVERVRPEVWEVLEEVIKGRPILLNRAPTLHRLGIQAFMPILIEGSAIQLHPLVCTAFNADFDGDQMAVHVPLSQAAVQEAKKVMLSTYNMLSPSSGEPIVAPTLDMVLGCFYLTSIKPKAPGEGKRFSDFDDAKLTHDLGGVALQAEILVRVPGKDDLKTTVGRIIFRDLLPVGLQDKPEVWNTVMEKKSLKEVIAQCYHLLGNERTADLLDQIKRVGFHYATRSGMTIAINDLQVPKVKTEIIGKAEESILQLEREYLRGLISEDERYRHAVDIWTEATDAMTQAVQTEMANYGSIYLMAVSGAKGNIAQIKQMVGMRGLMSDPGGRIIDLPVKSSFREGLSVLEYFISTHGARKGLADTALRTADSGYLTRRLVDVSQDVIVKFDDCGTTNGIWMEEAQEELLGSFGDEVLGSVAATDIPDPHTGEIIVKRNEEIDELKVKALVGAGIKKAFVRSPLGCEARLGICKLCYGRSLARGKLAELGEAVGIVAAQSIGEPGTQLTLRTFHTGGVAGVDITSGLPRVEELFEARAPKGQCILSDLDGEVEISETPDGKLVRVVSAEVYRDEYTLPPGYHVLVGKDDIVAVGAPLAEPVEKPAEGSNLPQLAPIVARVSGKVALERDRIVVQYEERDIRDYPVPTSARILVNDGATVKAGDQLTEGPKSPQDILRIMGREAVQRYLVQEVQKVYRSQGVVIDDKHIEIIVRQMLRKVRVDAPGDTNKLPGELVDRFDYEDSNAKVLAEGGEPATAQAVLLGVTKASLSTDSFLAAASFQETTRVLTEAALQGSVDHLLGLKENVIIGRLIPARFDLGLPEIPAPTKRDVSPEALLAAVGLGAEEEEESDLSDLQVPKELVTKTAEDEEDK